MPDTRTADATLTAAQLEALREHWSKVGMDVRPLPERWLERQGELARRAQPACARTVLQRPASDHRDSNQAKQLADERRGRRRDAVDLPQLDRASVSNAQHSKRRERDDASTHLLIHPSGSTLAGPTGRPPRMRRLTTQFSHCS